MLCLEVCSPNETGKREKDEYEEGRVVEGLCMAEKWRSLLKYAKQGLELYGHMARRFARRLTR